MHKTNRDHLFELTVRQIRLEAKKSSIHLYSRKNKKELVELILKDREKDLIEDKNNDERIAEEERIALENGQMILVIWMDKKQQTNVMTLKLQQLGAQ